jgi:hypothetical protein
LRSSARATSSIEGDANWVIDADGGQRRQDAAVVELLEQREVERTDDRRKLRACAPAIVGMPSP